MVPESPTKLSCLGFGVESAGFRVVLGFGGSYFTMLQSCVVLSTGFGSNDGLGLLGVVGPV